MDLHAQQVPGISTSRWITLFAPGFHQSCKRASRGKQQFFTRFGRAQNGFSLRPKRWSGICAIVAKERRSATETEALYLIGEVEGRDVLLVDDLTETAGTLTSAAELLKKRGAQKIYASVFAPRLWSISQSSVCKSLKLRN